MDYDEFKRQVGKAGLTLKAFAALLDVKPASLSNYAKKGTVPRRLAIVAVLMAELADNHVDIKLSLSRAGIK